MRGLRVSNLPGSTWGVSGLGVDGGCGDSPRVKEVEVCGLRRPWTGVERGRCCAVVGMRDVLEACAVVGLKKKESTK